MALQAGMGISRLVLIIGTGSVGIVLLRNGKLSDVLGELRKLLSKEEGEDLKEQLQRMREEVRWASQSRPIIINGNSSNVDISSVLVPFAAAGALGYGYMRWKGISFSDLMYVTKRSMATAVENLTKHLENVSEKLDSARKHLTQRIENLDAKLDEQVELSKLIRMDVSDVRGNLSVIDGDLDELQKMIAGLGDKLLTMEEKQELANMGVLYLCGVANGKQVKMAQSLQQHLKGVSKSVPTLMGLKELETLCF